MTISRTTSRRPASKPAALADPGILTSNLPAETGTDPAILFADLTAGLADAFAVIEWAEDEIAQATGRHPGQADALYHSFSLIRPRDLGHPGMRTEFVYRAHARELLERIAAGTDTRPATAAELCLVCAQISLRAPMHDAGAGLYFRLWLHAFPAHPITADQAEQQVFYERLHGPQIDELERTLRRKTCDPNRQLTDVECGGKHHGKTVNCRYLIAHSIAAVSDLSTVEGK